MDWSAYYAAQVGRGVRATFVAGLEARGDDAPGLAIDIGCGDGTETRALLAAGWSVLAIDADPGVLDRVRAGVGAEALQRLTVDRRDFADIGTLPDADLVYAGFSLPFCPPAEFESLWAYIRAALNPGAVFAGEFFGPHDSWASRSSMNVHDRDDIERLLDGLDIIRLTEENEDGRSPDGAKHWHIFHVVAQSR